MRGLYDKISKRHWHISIAKAKDTEHLQFKWGINFSLCAHYNLLTEAGCTVK